MSNYAAAFRLGKLHALIVAGEHVMSEGGAVVSQCF